MPPLLPKFFNLAIGVITTAVAACGSPIILPCPPADLACPGLVKSQAMATYELFHIYAIAGIVLESSDGALHSFGPTPFINASDGAGDTALLLQVNAPKAQLKVRADAAKTINLPGVEQAGSIRFTAGFSQTYLVQASEDTEMKIAFEFDGEARSSNYLNFQWGFTNGPDPFPGDQVTGENLNQTWSKSTNGKGRTSTIKVKKGRTQQSLFMGITGIVLDGGSLHFDNTFDFKIVIPDSVQIYAESPSEFPAVSPAQSQGSRAG